MADGDGEKVLREAADDLARRGLQLRDRSL